MVRKGMHKTIEKLWGQKQEKSLPTLFLISFAFSPNNFLLHPIQPTALLCSSSTSTSSSSSRSMCLYVFEHED